MIKCKSVKRGAAYEHPKREQMIEDEAKHVDN